jgi:hypothetical protein
MGTLLELCVSHRISRRRNRDRGTGYRLHRDMKGFAKRLIAIVEPQLQSDLSRAQLKSRLPWAFVLAQTSRPRSNRDATVLQSAADS